MTTATRPASARPAPYATRHPGVATGLALVLLAVGVVVAYLAWVLAVWSAAAAVETGDPWLVPVLVCLSTSSAALAAAPALVAALLRSRGWWLTALAAALVPWLVSGAFLLPA